MTTLHTIAGRLSLALLLMLGAPASGVLAQDFPSTPPAPGEPKPFSLPEIHTFTLDNGLDVTLVPYGALPKVSVSVAIGVGNAAEGEGEAAEGEGEAGLADFAADILTEGTTSRSAEAIAEAAASMGGSVFSGAGLDQTTVGGRALSEFAPDLVRLVADLTMNPSFPEDAFARLRSDALRGAAIARSQPGTLAQAAFRRVLYGAHPYATTVLPLPADIEAATLENARAFYDMHYGPQRAHVYVAGLFDVEAVEAAIRESFGSWAAETLLPPPDAEFPDAPGRRVLLVDQPGAQQSNVILGTPSIGPGDDDYITLSVMNSLLGGSFGSRITRNIREDKGYTYSPSSSVSNRLGGSYWAESAAIQTPFTGPAIAEILYEIDSLATNPPSQEELEGIQNYMAGTFVLQNSSADGIAAYFRFLDLYGIDREYVESYVREVYAVTPEDVSRAAREFVRGDDALIVVVGDRAAIEAQLTEFGEVEITTLD